MSAHRLTKLERAVLRNVLRGNACWDGRTEAGRLATWRGCLNALARLRTYELVSSDTYALTPAGYHWLLEGPQ